MERSNFAGLPSEIPPCVMTVCKRSEPVKWNCTRWMILGTCAELVGGDSDSDRVGSTDGGLAMAHALLVTSFILETGS